MTVHLIGDLVRRLGLGLIPRGRKPTGQNSLGAGAGGGGVGREQHPVVPCAPPRV